MLRDLVCGMLSQASGGRCSCAGYVGVTQPLVAWDPRDGCAWRVDPLPALRREPCGICAPGLHLMHASGISRSPLANGMRMANGVVTCSCLRNYPCGVAPAVHHRTVTIRTTTLTHNPSPTPPQDPAYLRRTVARYYAPGAVLYHYLTRAGADGGLSLARSNELRFQPLFVCPLSSTSAMQWCEECSGKRERPTRCATCV